MRRSTPLPRQSDISERTLLIGVFLVSLFLRVLAIHVPINIDEGLWIRRGPRFLLALLNGDLPGTYIRHHPGVPNMWMIGAVSGVRCLFRNWFPTILGMDQADSLHACLQMLTTWPFFPVSFYASARLAQAIVTSASMAGFYFLARRLVGRPVALGATVLLALEPYFLAYQRAITTDAFQADFGILGLLLLLLYLRGDRDRRWLAASGILMGLATSSKIPALFSLPAVAAWVILIELGVWQESFPRQGWRRQAIDLAIWGGIILIVFCLLWPAVWSAPMQTLKLLYHDLQEEADGHNQFFLGHFTRSPGPLFYPFVLAYRLSPILQIGLVAGLIALAVPRLRRRMDHVPELTAVTLIPLVILAITTLSMTKIDRYIIPMIPSLALLAASGWREIGAWTARWTERARRSLQESTFGQWLIAQDMTTAAVLGLAQLVFLACSFPYYLTYYNPLLGGARVAQRVLMIGNGEGLDRAARWLNGEPDSTNITAASWYAEAFAPYFRGTTFDVRKSWSTNTWPWTNAHRVVLYINQFQRRVPEAKMIDYFASQVPLYTVRIHGVDYVRVYPGPVPLPEELGRIQVPLSMTFGGQVRLLGYDLTTPQVASGGELVVTFYWEILKPPPPDSTVYMGIRDPHGNRWGRSDTPLLEGYLPIDQLRPGQVLRDAHRLTVLPGTPPGRYEIEIGWYSPQLGHALEVRDAAGNPQGAEAAIGEIEVTRPGKYPNPQEMEIAYRQSVDVGPLRLLGYDRPTGPVQAGNTIPLTLFWQRLRRGDASFQVSLRLRQGDQIWQRRQPHLISEMYPPASWEKGEVVREQWQALLPARVPSGRYELLLQIGQEDGSLLNEVSLGEVDVIARPHRYELPTPPFSTEAVLGQAVRLLGYDIQPRQATPGDVLSITLYWQALAEMDRPYKVFVHLVDENGQIRGQRDSEPLNGEAPTTTWVPGEVLQDDYKVILSSEAPPGRYSLRVGLYDPVTWQRLPVTGEHGRGDYIELGSIEVGQ
ncbi:MAG: phospholipid carrier-dependent glycosyltransferase [Chloroflexi bacterium]|nr:phospholipid carrier-dependent glycosyltransferase [Chloroflexota bacterium]